MIEWNKVTWYSQILAIVLGIAIFSIGLYIGSNQQDRGKTKNEEYTYKMPVVDLPPSYFDESRTVGSGEAEMGERYFIFDYGSQSFPTTAIILSVDDYSNEVKELPKIKSREEILVDAEILLGSFEEQLDTYGELARRYLPDYYITDIKKFDIDGDKKVESIISLCGGGNHCPDRVIIVKDGRTIFSTIAGVVGPKVVASPTSNGFYVEWAPHHVNDGSKWDVGLCCIPGYIKTRFVFSGGKFTPVYEQEVLYLRVEDK